MLASDVTPYKKNAKKHPKEQVQKIANSIQRFGWAQPLVVDKDNQLIIGHGRLEAAKLLQLETVPVLRMENLTQDEVNALRLADNKLNESEWDMDLVDLELGELPEDLKVLTGFDLMVTQLEAQEDDFDTTPPVEPKAQRGDVYALGEHRLMCGDSTKIEDVELLMDGQKADMVFTDPPYNTGMSAKNNAGSTRLNHMFNDDYSPEEWQNFLKDFCGLYWIFSKDDSAHYVCLNWKRSHELVPVYTGIGFLYSNLIIWDKVVHGLGSDYQYTHEFIHVFKKGKPDIDSHQGDKEYQDVWRIQRKVGKDEEHATKKPIELVDRALRHATKQGDSVLDLFGGSGSTLIACEQTNRKCYMMELDPKYIDVIISRWEKITGKQAVKLN